MELELRMYGLVPYNISPIQQGIQYGHSKDEYTLAMFEMLDKGLTEFDSESIKVYQNYRSWLKTWKTYIILNGGTTNNNTERLGTLNQHLKTLRENGVYCTEFYEPDLGDQLTGVDFIVDERVFGKTETGSYKWLDFEDWLFDPYLPGYSVTTPMMNFIVEIKPRDLRKTFKEASSTDYKNVYNKWVEYMGGHSNVFLRDFLKQFRLA